MAVKVFLLGRPGSGKTTAFHYIEMLAHDKGWHATHFTRFREYTILREMCQADTQDRFLPAAHGGFDILDFSVFNQSAKSLEERVQKYLSTAQKNELVFIELARDDYCQAMKFFSCSFLRDSYFLFIEADVETCIRRIHWRIAHPTMTDGHFVSDHILRSYYSKDNLQYMASNFKTDYDIQKEVGAIDNTGLIGDFVKKLEPFASAIFSQEVSVK